MKKIMLFGLLVAWVMWWNYRDKYGQYWEPQGAFETRVDCVAELKAQTEGFRAQGNTVTLTGSQLLIRGKDHADWVHVCLPDTVDPRPKGKE